MNVFNQHFFALLFTGFLVRCFLWVAWVYPGDALPQDPDADEEDMANGGIPVSIRAFLITYPSLNIIICSMFLQYPWIFDVIVLTHGRRTLLIQR